MENQVIAAYRQEIQRVEDGEIPAPSRQGHYDDDDDHSVMEERY